MASNFTVSTTQLPSFNNTHAQIEAQPAGGHERDNSLPLWAIPLLCFGVGCLVLALIGFVLRRKNYEELFDDGKPLPKAVSDEVQTDRAEEIELRRIGTPAPFVMIPYPAESDMVIPSQQNHMSDSRGPYNPELAPEELTGPYYTPIPYSDKPPGGMQAMERADSLDSRHWVKPGLKSSLDSISLHFGDSVSQHSHFNSQPNQGSWNPRHLESTIPDRKEHGASHHDPNHPNPNHGHKSRQHGSSHHHHRDSNHHSKHRDSRHHHSKHHEPKHRDSNHHESKHRESNHHEARRHNHRDSKGRDSNHHHSKDHNSKWHDSSNKLHSKDPGQHKRESRDAGKPAHTPKAKARLEKEKPAKTGKLTQSKWKKIVKKVQTQTKTEAKKDEKKRNSLHPKKKLKTPLTQ